MPKRNNQRRWRDPNEFAYELVERSIKEEPTADELSRVMAALGRKGGKIGGKKRMETMTPEERKEIAIKAAKARWKKRGKN